MNMNVEALKDGVKLPEIAKKLPKVAVASGISGLIVAALILMTPNPLFEAFIVETGLPGIISSAAPPLGAQARIVFALIAALMVTVFAYFGLKAVLRSKLGQAISDPVSVYDLDDEAFMDAPALRRADAHPDHPPRAPIMANDEMGTPLDLVDVAEDDSTEDADATDFVAEFNAESPLWDKPMKAKAALEAAAADIDEENEPPRRKRTFGPQPDPEPEPVSEAMPESEPEPELPAAPESEFEATPEPEYDAVSRAEGEAAAHDDLDDDYEVVEWDETGEDDDAPVSPTVEAEAEPEPEAVVEQAAEPATEPELPPVSVSEPEAGGDAQADVDHALETLTKPDVAEADISELIVRLEAGLERRKMRFDKAHEAAEQAASDNVSQHPGVAQAVPEDEMDGALREALDALKKVTAKGA